MKKLLGSVIFILFAAQLTAQLPDVKRYLDTFCKSNNFNGNILLAKDGVVQYHRSFGLANIPFKIPATIQTKYKVASITKLFTSVLIMQLVEEGQMDLQKTIGSYLADYKGEAAHKVTIEQLLTMTSGMRNMDEGVTIDRALAEGIPQYQRPYTSDQMLSLYSSDSLVNKPGSAFDYNNAEYIILGKIIEKISGRSFEQHLNEKILKPLKMGSSGMLKHSDIIDQLADTYWYRDEKKILVKDIPMYIENWYAAGAMYSTAGDVLKFTTAFFGKRILAQASLDKMFRSGPGEYGYGVWVYKEYDIGGRMYTIVKRPGSIMGAQAMIFQILEDNATIIVLSNTLTVNMDEFVAQIANKWFGKK